MRDPYVPERIGAPDLEQLTEYVERELRRISGALLDQRYAVRYEEVDRPRIGQVEYADGVNWNPGDGEGLYSFNSEGEWDALAAGSVRGREIAENTSTAPLGAGQTFTGEYVQGPEPDVMVSLQTDTECTLFFDFSPDGTNDNTFPVEGFRVAPGIHEFHVAVKGPRFFRVRLVNAGGAQTYLRLYTYFGSFRKPNAPLNQTLGLDSDATLVRTTDFQDEVRIGRRSGVAGFTKFGYRAGLTAAAGFQQIWTASDNTFTPMDTANTFTVTYTPASDGAGTTGALTLQVVYVDADGNPAQALHTLGSSGSDVTSFTGLGINRVAVASSGSNSANVADITFTATTDGTTQAVVTAGDSVTEQAIYFVGSNADAVVKYLWFNVGKGSGGGNPKVNVRGRVYNRRVQTYYTIFTAIVNTITEQTIFVNEPVGFNLSPDDVVFFEADTDTNGAEINLRFSLNEYQRT